MSGSGITPINSGPLVIRTYLDSSSNNTYVLRSYDLPISSNYVLITSSGGLLAPSDNIYLSSITVSSLVGSTMFASSITASNTYASTLLGSTNTLTTVAFSSIAGSSIQGTTALLGATLPASTVITGVITMSSVIGYVGNSATVNNLTVNTQFSSMSSIANLGNVSFTYLMGTGSILASTMSTLAVSTTSISTSMLSTNSVTVTALNGISTLSTNNLSYVSGIGNTLSIGSFTVNSTLYGSTINATTLTFSSLIGNTLSNTVSVNSVTSNSTLNISTGIITTINTISSIGSTLFSNQSYLAVGTYSTLRGSTLIAPVFTTSTLYVSTLIASTSAVTTQTMSSITGSTMFVSTLSGNAITIAQINTLGGTYSTMTGNTVFISTTTTSTLYVSTLTGSTLTTSTLFVSTATGSTMTVSTLTSQQIAVSTVIGSTMFQTNTNVSTFIVPAVFASTVLGASINIPLVTVGTIDGFTIGTGGGGQLSNTGLGYNTLPANTTGINNTAFGYASLFSNTTGSNNTAFGIQTLYSNTTGSYNTAVGYNAGYIAGSQTGSYNTYIGYYATPSTISVTNEIVVGGSYTNTVANTGTGNNSVTIGNSATVKNRIYGNVAIGSNTAGSALTVNGSYQQIGGSMAVYNTSSGYAQWWLFNDNAAGSGMFLNTSVRGAIDGGNYTGTFRNDYGSIRFQGSGGYNNANGLTILASGYVGIGSAVPQFTLDVIGGIRCMVDGSTTNIEGSNSAIAAYAPGAPTALASVWMGYDPTNNCGYLNCARAGYIRPICIQTRGGSVGVGGTTDSSYTLDVKGTGHFSGVVIVGGNITCGSLYIGTTAITSSSQWTGTTSLSYGYGVTVNATFSATTYSGLPVVDTTAVTQGMVQAAPSLSITNGYLSATPPFFQGSLTNGGAVGVFDTCIAITGNLVSRITTTNINVTYAFTATCNSITVTYSGYYLVTMNGYTSPTTSWGTITLYLGTSTNQSLSSATVISRTYTCNFGNCGTSLSAVVYISNSNNYLFLVNTYGGNYTMNLTVQWLSN